MRHYSTVTRLVFETLTHNPDNRGNLGRVVPFNYLPGCCGYGSPRSAFSRRELLPAVIVVSEVIGYCSLLMNSRVSSPFKASRGVERHSSLATSHSMLSAVPVPTQAPLGSTLLWLSNFRRLVVRYKRRAENYLGFVHLGCLVILLRYL